VKYSQFLTRLVEFPKLPEHLALVKVLEAVQDFCEYTWRYSEVLTFLTTAGTYRYDLTPTVTTDEIIGVFEKQVQSSTIHTPQPTATAATAGAGTLVPATTYQYQVTATKDDYGETLPCAAVEETVGATGIIELAWDAIDGAGGYNVYRNHGAGGSVFGYMNAVTTASYDDDGTDTPDVTVTPPTESVLMKEIEYTNHSLMHQFGSTWRHREGDSVRRVLYEADAANNRIRVDPIPTESGIGVQLRVALKPATTGNKGDATVPAILERHLEVIDEGIRWKLHLLPASKDVTWSSTELGAYHRKRFLIGCSKANVVRAFGHAGPATMRPRRSPWF